MENVDKSAIIAKYQKLAKTISRYEPTIEGISSIDRIVANPNLSNYNHLMHLRPNSPEWINLSKMYFNEPQYQRIILYYAGLYLYYYYVSPTELETLKTVNHNKLDKEYRALLKFLDDDINIETFSLKAMIDVLVEGTAFYYYDWVNVDGKPYFQITKLPREYCTILGTAKNNQLPIFKIDLRFIDDIINNTKKYGLTITEEEILKQYPKEIVRAYKSFKSSKSGDSSLLVTPIHGTVFSSYNGLPPFAQVIRQILRMRKFEDVRDDYIETSLQKILFQHVEVTKDGDPEIDLALAAEFHDNLKKITKQIERLNAFTSLADVKVLDLNDTSRDSDLKFIQEFEEKLYNEAGVPQELFDASTAGTLDFAAQKDESFMWGLIKQIELWLNFIVNAEIGAKPKQVYNFVVSYLPLSYRNREKMTSDYLKNAQFGYSKLIPQIAVGVKQRHFESLLYLENNLLKLDERLIPLKSSHTMGGEATPTTESSPVIGDDSSGNGRPSKTTSDKKDGTLERDVNR